MNSDTEQIKKEKNKGLWKLLFKIKVADSDKNLVVQNKSSTFGLRKKIVELSQGMVRTHEAYSKDPRFGYEYWLREDGLYEPSQKKISKPLLAKKESWVTERADEQEIIIDNYLKSILRLSEVIVKEIENQGDHTMNEDVFFYAYRGNVGAGKTTTMHSDPVLGVALDTVAIALGKKGKTEIDDFEKGILSPDTFKAALSDLGPPMNSTQVHVESVALNDRLRTYLIDKLKNKFGKFAFVVDQRFIFWDNVEDVFDIAKKSGKTTKMKIVDIDVSFAASLQALLGRTIDQHGARIGFKQVESGFEEILENRVNFLVNIFTDDRVESYELYSRSVEKKPELICKKDNDHLEIMADKVKEFLSAIGVPSRLEASITQNSRKNKKIILVKEELVNLKNQVDLKETKREVGLLDKDALIDSEFISTFKRLHAKELAFVDVNEKIPPEVAGIVFVYKKLLQSQDKVTFGNFFSAYEHILKHQFSGDQTLNDLDSIPFNSTSS